MPTNARLSMMLSVKSLTLQTYTSGWNHWLEYTKVFKFDRFVCTPLTEWPSDSAYSFQHSAISSFMTFSYFELNLQPFTINSYLSDQVSIFHVSTQE